MADVLILGAGISGLSAAINLSRAGLSVEILEARNRIGGRILTQFDPVLNHPVELGAEFVHGMSPEIWLPVQQHNLKITEVEGDLWCSLDGRLQPCNFFRQADKILEEMNDSNPDESFLDFLVRKFPGNDHADAKRWATGYVSGFNAANPADVSVHWLAHSRHADEQIHGDRAFHISGGYQKLLDIFLTELNRLKVPIHLETIVRKVEWSRNLVRIEATRGHMEAGVPTRPAEQSPAQNPFSAPKVLITFPLGVLQANSLRFSPDLPAEKHAALEKLAMGKVVRVTLCFRDRFWERIKPASKTLANLSFLFSRHDLLPTWWTQMPEAVPIITGWAPAKSAETLAGMGAKAIVTEALDALASLLGIETSRVRSQLRTAYFHDWDSDPFSRGAYSYVKVGGEGCQKILGIPIEGKLFFAGEATDISGHNGTVHGAIASAHRACNEILAR